MPAFSSLAAIACDQFLGKAEDIRPRPLYSRQGPAAFQKQAPQENQRSPANSSKAL